MPVYRKVTSVLLCEEEIECDGAEPTSVIQAARKATALTQIGNLVNPKNSSARSSYWPGQPYAPGSACLDAGPDLSALAHERDESE